MNDRGRMNDRWLDRTVEMERSLWLAIVLMLADESFPEPVESIMRAVGLLLLTYWAASMLKGRR